MIGKTVKIRITGGLRVSQREAARFPCIEAQSRSGLPRRNRICDGFVNRHIACAVSRAVDDHPPDRRRIVIGCVRIVAHRIPPEYRSGIVAKGNQWIQSGVDLAMEC